MSWNFRKPPEPFPQTPGCNGVFLAPSGMGKTTTLIAMLLGPYRHCFDQIHVFSPSVEIDSAWGPVKQFAEHLSGSSFHSEWDEPALRKLLDEQKESIKKLKDYHGNSCFSRRIRRLNRINRIRYSINSCYYCTGIKWCIDLVRYNNWCGNHSSWHNSATACKPC